LINQSHEETNSLLPYTHNSSTFYFSDLKKTKNISPIICFEGLNAVIGEYRALNEVCKDLRHSSFANKMVF